MALPKDPMKPIGKVAGPIPSKSTPTNPLAQYTSPTLGAAPGAPNVNVGSGSYPDLMLSATTGGAITDANKFSADVDKATQALAAKHLATNAPVGSGVGDPYASALAAATGAYNTGKSDLLHQSGLTDSDLAQIFIRTNQAQRELQSHAIQGFHANNARIGSTYDDLLGRIAGNYKGGAGNVVSELARLGLQQAQPGAMQGLVRDAGFATDMASADKANALTNNNSASSLLANLMSGIRESTAASGASSRAQNKINTQQELAKLAQQLVQAKANIAMGLTASGKKAPKAPLTIEEKAKNAEDLKQAKAALELQRLLGDLTPKHGFGL